MKRSRKISFHIFYLTPVHSSSLYVGGASFDIRSSHAGPPALELGNAAPLLLRNRTTADRLQPNADSSAQWTLGCLPHDELTVWTPETSLFPWRGRLHYEPASAAARCLLLGHALRTVVESDSTVRPLTKSSNTTVFCYLLKWIHFFFFFSNSSGTLIFLNRILNRNPIWEG